MTTFLSGARLGIAPKNPEDRLSKPDYYSSGQKREKKAHFYLLETSGHMSLLFRERHGHAIISYIQDFDLDFISFGEDGQSFLNKIKETWP